ncbi:MAG TPA: M28 family peptidase [Bryobacteraceae bacterium]|nr:M28 family peptidase [Bryobacteraceae bacterium]
MSAVALLPVSLVLTLGFAAAPVRTPSLTPAERAAMARISADSLRGRLSFLSSDLLEGRDTPSSGLDIAAAYIASGFRRAGLEPGGDDGYLQTAHLVETRANPRGFELTLSNGNRKASVGPESASLSVFRELHLKRVPVYKLDLSARNLEEQVHGGDMNGRVVLMQGPTRKLLGPLRKVFAILRSANPDVIVMVGGDGLGIPEGVRLREEGRGEGTGAYFADSIVHVTDAGIAEFFASLPAGKTQALVTINVSAPTQTPVKVHNVIGILRGSDPALKDTCVLVTAHYDHLGLKPPGPGDRIYNGANDDGSGTVSVMELADALAASRVRPRRSVVFITFYGEEKGVLGSRYYAEHPVFPLGKTVADINLEQMGRTDSTEGPQIANASVTGFGYSTVTDTLELAGRLTGIRVYKHPKNSDAYFALSDNQALADAGVPAHTLCVAFDYPDYHGVGDEWTKIDYNNMAKVDRMVAVALLRLANSARAPEWSATNPLAARYLETRRSTMRGR